METRILLLSGGLVSVLPKFASPNRVSKYLLLKQMLGSAQPSTHPIRHILYNDHCAHFATFEKIELFFMMHK